MVNAIAALLQLKSHKEQMLHISVFLLFSPCRIAIRNIRENNVKNFFFCQYSHVIHVRPRKSVFFASPEVVNKKLIMKKILKKTKIVLFYSFRRNVQSNICTSRLVCLMVYLKIIYI